MKIAGQKVDAGNFVETIVIPKGDTQYVFKAKPVSSSDFALFEALVKLPMPPTVLKPGIGEVTLSDDPSYLIQRMDWARKKSQFTFMMSLSATPDLEWETVDAEKPDTWGNIQSELEDAGFTPTEVNAIMACAVVANGLDSDKIEKATKDFLAMMASQEA